MPGDREVWDRHARADMLRAARVATLERRSLQALDEFVSAGGGYLGVSWGKDSVVVAHLLHELGVEFPVVCLRPEFHANPDCDRVRDAFLERFDIDYHEIELHYTWDEEGWHATGTMERGFREASALFGDRHVSGVRGAESGVRKIAMRRWGLCTDRTCRPIGWWSTDDVFAYLAKYDLPIHPAYAMTMGGAIDRERLRIGFFGLGGTHGMANSRDWDSRYYPDAIEAITSEWERRTGLRAGERYVV